MGVVQLNAVESGPLGPARGGGKDLGEYLREISDMGEVKISYQLALAVHERVELTGCEYVT